MGFIAASGRGHFDKLNRGRRRRCRRRLKGKEGDSCLVIEALGNTIIPVGCAVQKERLIIGKLIYRHPLSHYLLFIRLEKIKF